MRTTIWGVAMTVAGVSLTSANAVLMSSSAHRMHTEIIDPLEAEIDAEDAKLHAAEALLRNNNNDAASDDIGDQAALAVATSNEQAKEVEAAEHEAEAEEDTTSRYGAGGITGVSSLNVGRGLSISDDEAKKMPALLDDRAPVMDADLFPTRGNPAAAAALREHRGPTDVTSGLTQSLRPTQAMRFDGAATMAGEAEHLRAEEAALHEKIRDVRSHASVEIVKIQSRAAKRALEAKRRAAAREHVREQLQAQAAMAAQAQAVEAAQIQAAQAQAAAASAAMQANVAARRWNQQQQHGGGGGPLSLDAGLAPPPAAEEATASATTAASAKNEANPVHSKRTL